MPDGVRWVGLDVHACESTIAIFDQGTGELTTRRVVGRPHELLPWLRAVAKPARMVYEAGPTGYGLARRARGEGIELVVCAPSKTERPPADRVKTDKRDAIRRARLLAAGELTLVTIPSVEREQLRDLVRCREDIRVDLMRARHRIGGFLLRREIYWEGPGEAWSRKHRSWLTSVQFADQASQATLAEYLHAHDVLIARRDQVEADLAKLAVTAPCAQAVARLRCLRGIDTLSALGLCAEIGEWGRFDHPDQLASYLGIVPFRAHQRPPTTARIDHQGRLHPRPPAARRSGLPLPSRTRSRRGARAPPTRAIATGHQHRLARAASAQRPLAPAQRRAAQTQRDRRRRDRARTRRLLLGDRYLGSSSSRPGSAGIPAGGRPPHTRSLAPTEAHTNHSQETHQLTLTPNNNPVRLARRPELPASRTTTPRFVASAATHTGSRARL
jgi:transposase